MAVSLARARALATKYMTETAVIYRPAYASTGGPTTVATVSCRVATYQSGGGSVLDSTGEASHTLHVPAGTDLRAGDEVAVGANRYLVLATNAGRSLDYDVQAACRRQG